jgi:transposase InsO family protein
VADEFRARLDAELASRARYQDADAVAESFFAILKRELIYTRSWPGRAALRAELFDYIETFYNRKRIHSTLGYVSPARLEADFEARQAA